MTVKQKPIIECDYCKKEIKTKKFLQVKDVPNEGCSELVFDNNVYYVENSDFCNLTCFVEHIKKSLGGESFLKGPSKEKAQKECAFCGFTGGKHSVTCTWEKK